MRKYDLIGIVLLSIAVLAVTATPEDKEFQQQITNYFANGSIIEAATLPMLISVETVSYEKSIITRNGVAIILGTVKREINETMLKVPLADRDIEFKAFIEEGESLTYVRVRNILIVPRNNVEFNTERTTYYQNGKILEISIADCNLTGVDVFSNNGPPTLLIADKSNRWGYDAESKIISLESERPICSILFYWNGILNDKVIFMEDTREIEAISYAINSVEFDNNILTNSVEVLEEPITELRGELNEIKNKTDGIVIQKNELETIVAEFTIETEELNQTVFEVNNQTTELKTIISGNVLVSPLSAGLGLIIGLILIILLIDVFFLNKKGEKKNEK